MRVMSGVGALAHCRTVSAHLLAIWFTDNAPTARRIEYYTIVQIPMK
jgi:hypothetical protein